MYMYNVHVQLYIHTFIPVESNHWDDPAGLNNRGGFRGRPGGAWPPLKFLAVIFHYYNYL